MSEQAIRTAVQEILATGGRVFETVHRTREGAEFPVEVHSTPVTYGGRAAVMSIARDISSRRRHEEIQRNARKAEGLVEHGRGRGTRFQQPVPGGPGQPGTGPEPGRPHHQVAAHIDRARAALDRAGSLAQRIQQFSGGVLRVLEPTDLNRITESLREDLEVPPDTQWELARDLPSILLDPGQARLAARLC